MWKKFDATSTRMVFVGYGDRFGVKAYRLYDLPRKKFQFSHSVYFDEMAMISPQHGVADTTLPNSPMPHTQNRLPGLSPTPQVEWEELDGVHTPLPLVQPPLPVPPPVPTSLAPIKILLPHCTPPWPFRGKTGSFLFPQSPNPL